MSARTFMRLRLPEPHILPNGSLQRQNISNRFGIVKM
jgi:hypothetical protein